MRLISLRKYLERASRGGEANAGCGMLCRDLLTAVLQEPCGEAAVPEEIPDEALFAAAAERLAQWQGQREQREAEWRQEFQRLLAAFNRAVLALADGGTRASERFAAISQTLDRAVRANNLGAMRAAVYEAAETLRRESEAHRAETDSQVAALGRALEAVRGRTAGRARAADAGREAAVAALRAAYEADRTGAAVAAVVYDRLPALASRFGDAVAAEAMAAAEAEKLAPLAAGGAVYPWGPQTRVWLIECGDGAAVRDRLESELGEPFEYRAIIGNRTAVLLLEARWMWGLLADADLNAWIEEIDLFAAGAPIRR